jgi:hypothetical protein
MTVKNPLKEISLFVTPKDFGDLQTMIENAHGVGTSETALALRTMMFTQNLCARMFDEAIAKANGVIEFDSEYA